jgi:hypothetical protein
MVGQPVTRLYRYAAFSLFACAAFAWGLPWLDRAGTAALAFAFVALTVGRGVVGAAPANEPGELPMTPDRLRDAALEAQSIVGRIAEYEMAGDNVSTNPRS